MNKLILICLLTIFSAGLKAQEKATLTKEETINYINKKLKETEGISFKHAFSSIYKTTPKRETMEYDHMYINDNVLYLKPNGSITHTDKIATSLSACYAEPYNYGSKTCEVNFNPMYITKVEVVQTDDVKIGQLKISFLPNTEKWEKTRYEYKIQKEVKKKVLWYRNSYGNPVYTDETNTVYECQPGWLSTEVPTGDLTVYYVKSDPENGGKLERAFKHLISLYKAEDDPFGK